MVAALIFTLATFALSPQPTQAQTFRDAVDPGSPATVNAIDPADGSGSILVFWDAAPNVVNGAITSDGKVYYNSGYWVSIRNTTGSFDVNGNKTWRDVDTYYTEAKSGQQATSGGEIVIPAKYIRQTRWDDSHPTYEVRVQAWNWGHFTVNGVAFFGQRLGAGTVATVTLPIGGI